MIDKTPSDRARDLRARHPDMPIGAIATTTGLTESGVRAALKARAGRGAGGGRPAKPRCVHCLGTGYAT